MTNTLILNTRELFVKLFCLKNKIYYLCHLLIATESPSRGAIDTQEKQEKITRMKKIIFSTAACLLLSFVSLSAFADPKPPVPQFYGLTKEGEINRNPYNTTPKGNDILTPRQGPLTPATLLLLTLASGFAGVKIYRNNKEK